MAERKRKGWLQGTLFFLVLILVFAFGAQAAPPEGKGGGPPEGKGGDHGRKPHDPGGSTRGDLLGDLWVVVRNVSPEGDGAPDKFVWEWAETCFDAETGDFDPALEGCVPVSVQIASSPADEGCVQPISFDSVSDLETQFTFDGYVDSYGETQTVYLIPLDPECKIPAGYEETWGTQTIEVDSGRLALARTTSYVIEAAYDEAIATINSAVSEYTDENGDLQTITPVSLDAAGRLVVNLLDAEGQPYLKTIDSPRENLSLYQRLLLEMSASPGEGCLPGITVDLGEASHLVCGATPDDPAGDLLRAASFLAGAADKTGTIGIDEVIYLNSTLGINTVEETSDGAMRVTAYFDYPADFAYVRSAEYDGVTADLLQPGDTLVDGYPTSFDVVLGANIYAMVFGGNDWDGRGLSLNSPVVNFVRAADDAVGVVNYIHNYELPAYLVPPESLDLINLQRERGPLFSR